METLLIRHEELVEKISQKIVEANNIMREEIFRQLLSYEGPFCDVLRRNAEVAKTKGLPLCQDTGFIEFFIFTPFNAIFQRPVQESCDEAVMKVYSSRPYRHSVVSDPLYERRNTRTNTPSICHIFHWGENRLQIRLLIKGGGSENLTTLFMLPPTADDEELLERITEHVARHGSKGCPPLRVGVGVGGSADKAMLLSRLALTYSLNEVNPDPRYELLERRISEKLNQLRIGFQGLGVGPTVFSVHILQAPTHIANLPVAVSFDCYLSRIGVMEVEPVRIESRRKN
ncbi:MAG: Fumarase alpha subunit [Thermotoga sp. 50_1627]|uniref:fumarate hydratase n=1 Tax=Pseudothermotoga sp. TaxID=2033661 RepID=UPI00076D2A84|nr:MAG: Fumarase alpha subunit [Thermotoga sp. 50_64]KUK25930.1 MAG: Fumarase alpha subunit [Thermotoga sp. 50_1627]MDK2923869.1 fumarate hydratase subunit alpha [Pseudothermotoga sp.]